MKRIALVVLIIVICGSTLAGFWITSVKSAAIFPSIDSYSWQSVPDANNGGSDNFQITSYINKPNNMRGWLVFNISSTPPDVWVVTAKLRLRIWHKTTNDPAHNWGDSTGRTYGVYRLTTPWAEHNVTWTNQPNYTEEHHAVAAVPPGQGGWNGPVIWMEWDITDIVKEWRSGISNFGVLVRDTKEDSPILYSTQFFTHDQVPNQNYYPRLVVTYFSPQVLAFFLGLVALEGLVIIVLWGMKTIHFDSSKRT